MERYLALWQPCVVTATDSERRNYRFKRRVSEFAEARQNSINNLLHKSVLCN
jgi:hypothetical protein